MTPASTMAGDETSASSSSDRDRDEHGFDALHRGPPLRGGLAGHFVVAGGVKDRDAEAAVGVDVGVVEGADELEVWRGNY
jgi:hypothetical protein